MLAHSVHARMAFGPGELAAMAVAFQTALEQVGERRAMAFARHPDIVRDRIAAAIMAAAQDGVTDIEDLATEGLRALHDDNAGLPDAIGIAPRLPSGGGIRRG